MLIQMISFPACVPLCLFYGDELVHADKILTLTVGLISAKSCN